MGRLPRTKFDEDKSGGALQPLGTRPDTSNTEADDVASLLSDSSDEDQKETQDLVEDANPDLGQSDPSSPDIRGVAMLRHSKFYQLWGLLGLLTGIGLMTIK